MTEGNYWSTRPLSRRRTLQGAGLGLFGLAGAALVGCGGEDNPAATGGATSAAGGTSASGGSTSAAPAGQVRLTAGETYSGIFPTAAEADPVANGKQGGTFRFRIFDSPHMDFNRILSSTVNTPNDLTKNKLIRLKLGAQADPAAIAVEPDLAESYEVSDDATQYTFHLHKGVKFHNVEPTLGRELDAEDVKLSIERYQAGGVQKDVFADVTNIETPDDHTVVITLGQALGEFPEMVASWSYMDAREMIADPDYLRDHAVGTGPFIQESWTPKEGQEFARHPDYFEPGLPFLDRVVGNVIDDTNTLQSAFVTETVFDFGATNQDQAAQILQQAENAVLFLYKGAQGANVNGFHFQMTNPTWQDERVRRAFSMAIDRTEWAQAVFGVDDAAASGNGYSTGPMAWSVLHEDVPDVSTQGPYYQYNPDEAAKMLTAAGYSESSPITTELTAWYARDDWGSIMVPQLNMLPQINATFRQVDNPTAVTLLNERNFDITNITWGPPAYSVDQVLYPWYHSEGGLNHNNIDDPTMDELVTAQRSEVDPDKKKALWREAEARIYDQVWDVFTPTNFQRRGMWHNYVMNYRPHGLGNLTVYATAQLRAVWLDNV